MKQLGNKLLNEPALVYTGLTTAYAAAIAAGWEPVQGLAIGVAAGFAFFGVVLRQQVTPDRKLPKPE